MKTLFLSLALFCVGINMANSQTIVRSTKHLEEMYDASAGETTFKHWAHDLNEWAEITVSGKKTYEYLPYLNNKAYNAYSAGEAQFLQKVDKTNWKFYKVKYLGSIERIDVYFIDEVQLKSGVGEPRQKTVNGQTVYYLVLENFDKNSSYGLRAAFENRVYLGAQAYLGDRKSSAYETLEVYFQDKADADETYRLMLTTGR